MDHLPKPAKPFRQPLYPDVPYICTRMQYPAKSVGYEAFVSFPQDYGLSVEELQQGDRSLYHADDTLAVLQSWLFFGVLTEIFSGAGIPFNQEDFRLQNDVGNWFISTEPLQRYICYWIAARRHLNFEARRHHVRLVTSCLQLSYTVYMVTINRYRSLLMRESLDSPQCAVLLSIAILGETLAHASCVLSGTNSVRNWPFPPLARALLGAGWCTGDITTMSNECDSSTLLYLSTLDQHTLRKNHERCNAKKGCQAAVVDWNTYQTKHVEFCSKDQCDDIGPPIEEVGSILRDGDIPLIAMDTSVSPSQIEVVRYKEHSEYCNVYVAISHVWSDGLGNPKANTLPRCQLERIQFLVNSLDSEHKYLIPFWIDTICVPLIPELKSLAIMNMDKTYRNATSVLVLDKSWNDVSVSVSTIEIMMRIRYSTWMTRLWTFQEARLSQNLWFQLGNGPVHIDDVGVHLQPREAMQIVSEMLLKDDKIQLLAHPNKLQIARALAYRSKQAQQSLHKYAVLPRQDNEDEEAARLSAIQILSEQREEDPLRNTWHQVITDLNLESPLSDLDGDVRFDLHRPPDQVASYAMVMRYLVKGTGGGEAVGKVSPRATKPGRRPAHHLVDVIRGIRGRTTSRLEDETICLSVLLGLDVGRLMEIPVLHWKLKELLARLKDFVISMGKLCPHKKSFQVFPVIIERLLRRSHEDRMKVFLSQFEFFPEAMLFWNTPRLQRKGWSWAPFSFLCKNLVVDAPLKGGRRGYPTKEGLLIPCPALSLRISPFQHESDATMEKLTAYNYLRIEWAIQEEALPFKEPWPNFKWHYEMRKQHTAAMVWKWARLHQPLTWPMALSTGLDNKVQSRTSRHLLILLENDWMTGKKGALVSIYNNRGRCFCVDHIATLNAVDQEPNGPALPASAQWVPERMWCVA